MNAGLLVDGYKTSHAPMFPEGTVLVYDNFTPRANKYAPKGCQDIVVFGNQMIMQQIHEHFRVNFFEVPKIKVISQLKLELGLYLGMEYDTKYFEELHDLGYLPIKVKGLQEGTIVTPKIPVFTLYNTHPDFFWLPNYLETLISNLLWKPMTSASIAYGYKKVLLKYALETDKNNTEFVNFQGHDFSMRGLDSVDAAVSSGLGHLTSFLGTDTIPAILGARKYYKEEGFVGCSVPATEHSVMCAGSKEGELATFRRLLKLHKNSPVLSVVSDTWDLWNVITVILPQLKEEILAGNTKLVIRPDSGDPVDIICGLNIIDSLDDLKYLYGAKNIGIPEFYILKDNITYEVEIINDIDNNIDSIRCDYDTEYSKKLSEAKGVIELLWDIFGGTINEQGYKVLDPHIGAIYGDSITIERAEQICERLKAKGFASTNIVLGVGSFTYQYNTRDTYGFAMKATYVEKEEEFWPSPESIVPGVKTIGYPIFKDPITDDGTKKSATGLLQVYKEDGVIKLKDNCTWEEEDQGLLLTIYEDGRFFNTTTLTQIRERLNNV
jgi:nicotinamide phosphoribosyltransferase